MSRGGFKRSIYGSTEGASGGDGVSTDVTQPLFFRRADRNALYSNHCENADRPDFHNFNRDFNRQCSGKTVPFLRFRVYISQQCSRDVPDPQSDSLSSPGARVEKR